jgi:hypothetical protein
LETQNWVHLLPELGLLPPGEIEFF